MKVGGGFLLSVTLLLIVAHFEAMHGKLKSDTIMYL